MNIIKCIGAVLVVPIILIFGLFYLVVTKNEDKDPLKSKGDILRSL